MATQEQPHLEVRTIDVQVIRVGNRQMTQSVFRQLEELGPGSFDCPRDFITNTPEGWDIWGYVKHRFGGHLFNHHVVGVRDGKLFRVTIPHNDIYLLKDLTQIFIAT